MMRDTTPTRRVLLVCHGLPPGRIGGVELVTWRLARSLVAAGHAAAVLFRDDAPDARTGVLTRTERDGVAMYGLGVRAELATSPDARRAFASALRLWSPDLVWVHHLHGLDLALGGDALSSGIPLAVTLHDYWWMCPRGQLVDRDGARCPGPGRDRRAASRCAACLAVGAPWPLRVASRRAAAARADRRRRMARMILLDAAGVSAPSRHVARRHEAWLGRRGIVDVVPNPPPDLRRRPTSPGGAPPGGAPLRVGYFGALLRTKGIDTLLRAASQLPRGTVDLTLHGAFPEDRAHAPWRERVRRLAATAGARLAGPYDPADVGRLLGAVELVVVPSEWEENAPLVVEEAWAVGRPVAASDLGGLPELLADPLRGRLIPPGDVAAWSAALAETALWRRAVQDLLRSPIPTRNDRPEAVEWALGLTGR